MPLGEVADFINGYAFKPEDWHDDGLPIVRIQNLTDSKKPINLTTRAVPDKFRVRRGELLVSWSATLGVFVWDQTDEALVNQHIFRVVPSPEVDQGFLRYMLEGALVAMERHLHGATMRHVNRREFLSIEIPLPPMPEQRRIAAILDRADTVRAKRRETLTNIESLGESTYRSMFADAKASTTVGDIAQFMRTGPFGSQLLHAEFVDEGIAVLGLDNVVSNQFRWVERRYITREKYETLKRYTVQPGDVLISIMGTTGRCVVVPEGIPTSINTKHLCAITPDPSIDPEFLRASFLWHPDSRAHLARQTKGSVMDGLNMGIIRSMPVPTPTTAQQAEFAARSGQIRQLSAEMQLAAASDHILFASLQSRAFKGEL